MSEQSNDQPFIVILGGTYFLDLGKQGLKGLVEYLGYLRPDYYGYGQ